MNSFVIRGERVVLPDGVRPAPIQVRDGRIVEIVAAYRRRRGRRAHDRRRRAGRAAWARRHARPHQRSRSCRLGRVRARDARGRRRRRDDARRHAAQQHSGHDERRRASRRSGAPRRDAVTSTSGSGAASCRATRRALDAARGRGRARLQVLSRPSGVDEFEHVTEADLARGAADPRRARLAAPRARRAAERSARAGSPQRSARVRDLARQPACRRASTRRSSC